MPIDSPGHPEEPYKIDAPTFQEPENASRFATLEQHVTDWRIPSNRNCPCRSTIEQLAFYLSRERHYDPFLYAAHALRDKDVAHLYGITFDVGVSRAIGAAFFQFNQWVDRPPGYCLEWVWIHPYLRRTGILKESWPAYREEYGDFLVQGPYSPEMLRFLINVKHPCHVGTWEEWQNREQF